MQLLALMFDNLHELFSQTELSIFGHHRLHLLSLFCYMDVICIYLRVVVIL